MYIDQLRVDSPIFSTDFSDDAAKNVAPIIAGNKNSIIVGNGVEKTFVSNAFSVEKSDQITSLEAWCLPYTSQKVSILAGGNGGIYWDKGIEFTVKLSTGSYTIKYDYDERKCLHVVAEYSVDAISLYINGRLYDQISIEPGIFLLDESNFVAGAGSGRVAIDGIAFYDAPLVANVVNKHYRMGRDIPSITANLSDLGALIYNFEDQPDAVEIKKIWGVDESWTNGIYKEVSITDSITGTVGGMWQGIVPVPFTEKVKRSKINWYGIGDFVVESSLDNGQTWTRCEKLKTIPGVNNGIPGYNIDFRIIFNGPATVNKLEVVLYTTSEYNNELLIRDATLVGDIVTCEKVTDQIEYNELRGARMNNGRIEINSEVQAARQSLVYGIDMWFRLDDLKNTYIYSTTTGEYLRVRYGALETNGNVVYINGKLGVDHSIESGEWVHVTGLFGSGTNAQIFVGSASVGSGSNDLIGQIGSVNLYANDIGSDQVERIYRAYTGGRKYIIEDNATVGVTELVNAWDLYSYSWSNA